MAFGALKSAEAVVDALRSKAITPERMRKVLRHVETPEEVAAVRALLKSKVHKALFDDAAQKHADLQAVQNRRRAR